jgi:hypothetical protein
MSRSAHAVSISFLIFLNTISFRSGVHYTKGFLRVKKRKIRVGDSPFKRLSVCLVSVPVVDTYQVDLDTKLTSECRKHDFSLVRVHYKECILCVFCRNFRQKKKGGPLVIAGWLIRLHGCCSGLLSITTRLDFTLTGVVNVIFLS